MQGYNVVHCKSAAAKIAFSTQAHRFFDLFSKNPWPNFRGVMWAKVNGAEGMKSRLKKRRRDTKWICAAFTVFPLHWCTFNILFIIGARQAVIVMY